MRIGFFEPSILFDREGIGFLGEVFSTFDTFLVRMMVETWKTENKN